MKSLGPTKKVDKIINQYTKSSQCKSLLDRTYLLYVITRTLMVHKVLSCLQIFSVLFIWTSFRYRYGAGMNSLG
jgi:hypothetical protein